MSLDYHQRYEDPLQVLKSVVEGRQVDLWTALPGIIQTFDPATLTVTVKPSIKGLVTKTDGSGMADWAEMPILPDVPVVFQHGGGYSLTFPIKPNDECLVIFSSRCIDNWWDQGGIQTQRELRMHDLSDGFAIVGPWSQKTKITKVSTTTVQLRSDDGRDYVELDSAKQTATVIVGGTSIVVDDPSNTVTVQGKLHVTGNITSDANISAAGSITAGVGGADQVSLQTHRHGTTGTLASSTLPPSPGT